MMTDGSVTLRDVAKKAGVSLATASRALRNDPVTRGETRERVKAAARGLGYRPDPGLYSFVERRWRGRRKAGGLNLAFLYSGLLPVTRKPYAKFRREAETHGYTLLEKDVTKFRDSGKLIHQLRSQGVAGLVLAQLPSTPYDLEPVLEKFPAVGIGVSAYRPSCPIIMHDEFLGISQVWMKLEERGFRRIGVMLPYHPRSVSMNLRLGAVLCGQYGVKPARNRVPLLFLKNDEGDKARLIRWLAAGAPDVVLGHEHTAAMFLEACGYGVPGGLAFATFNLWDSAYRGRIAGYFRDNMVLFRRGMQLLDMMIRTGSPGSRHAKLLEMVDGEWIDGRSLPLRR